MKETNKKQYNKKTGRELLASLPDCIVGAPMAGFTTVAYRNILKEFGAALAVSEMISAQALFYANQKTWNMLGLEYEEGRIAVQLSGHDPLIMAKAASMLEEKFASENKDLVLLDLNMGCPAPKIVKNHDGAALSLDMKNACTVAKAVVKAVKVPVSAKLRLGWDEENRNFLDMAKGLEQAGISLLTLHGRYRTQFYTGKADWQAVKELKQTVSIPVIGNGDVDTPAKAAAMLAETGCDGVMIGRGCIGNPWLMRDCAAYLAGREPEGRPSREEILHMALRHLKTEIEIEKSIDENAERAERNAVCRMRTHLGRYFKGLRGAAFMRSSVNALYTYAEIEDFLLNFKEDEV